MRALVFASSASILAMCNQGAYAQEADLQDEAESGNAISNVRQHSLNQLDVIVVTAQRRAETLQDAAIAINAVSGDDLIAAGVADASQLNKIAPALYVSTGGGANSGYFVRGVGNFTNNGYTSPAIAFNIDGVYVGRPSSTIASFLDVSRVEVLKGPQGTLYGRNATGGAINVIPNTPKLGAAEGTLRAQYGNYNAWELTGVVNAPVGDRVAIRLAGTVSDRDGYYSDGTSSAKDLALRGQIYAQLSDAVNVRLSGDYSTQKGTGPGVNIDGLYAFTPFNPNSTIPNWTFVPAPDNVSRPFTGLHAPQTLEFIENNAIAAPLYSPLSDYAYPFRDDEFYGVNAEVNVDLGGVDLVIVPAYRRSELDNQFNGPPFRAAINQDVAKQYSLEARLSGQTGPLDWIVGAYYFDETVKGVNSFNQFSNVNHNSFDSNTKSAAGFARATFSLTDALRLVGGIRYTHDKRSMVGEQTSTAGVCLIEPVFGPPSCPQVPTLPVGLTLEDTLAALPPGIFPGGSPLDAPNPYGAWPYGPFGAMGPQAILAISPTTINRSKSDSKITYRAAVEYDLTVDNLVYASFETGYRSGGFQITLGQEEYDPETIDAWTFGLKNNFFDNKVQLNLEAFYWNYKDQQLAALGVDAIGRNSFYTRNVGASSIKGVEIDFQVLATPTTLISGGVQYLDAKYDSFKFNQVDLSDETDPPNFLTPVTGCAYTQQFDPIRSFDIDCSGKQALYAPKWTLNLGVEQTIYLDGGELVAALSGRYRTDRPIGFNYLPTGNSGDDLTLDASIGFEPEVVPLNVTFFMRNLTNVAVPSTYQPGAGNVTSSAYEPPRTYGIRVGYEF
ncbi:TonB-dependent receptor [Novosphingobium profundi]|uniref:TonB-dependent receptor n=1 Tax=Novosphingobium profundi TaxID=1774954 RepID=UPI001CFC4EE2|nr:TonB-dependent receptor [Novosphingobium profundi]